MAKASLKRDNPTKLLGRLKTVCLLGMAELLFGRVRIDPGQNAISLVDLFNERIVGKPEMWPLLIILAIVPE